MNKKKYLAKIIAKDTQGLQLISACCSEAKVKIGDIKFLKKKIIFFYYLLKDLTVKKIKIMKKLVVFVNLSLLMVLNQ